MDYSVSLTAMHHLGCSDVHEEVITVFPAVVAAWMGATEGCAPLDATFALESNDNVSAAWNFNGSTFVGDSLNATLDGITGADAQHTIGLAVTSRIWLPRLDRNNGHGAPCACIEPFNFICGILLRRGMDRSSMMLNLQTAPQSCSTMEH